MRRGRAALAARTASGWDAATVFEDADGVRGIVTGDFPVGAAVAPAVAYGSTRACRALFPAGPGAAWSSVTLFEDRDRGHWLAAADLVPGNGSDELVLASCSGRVVVLVATEGGTR